MDKVLLRPLKISDAEISFHWRNDPAIRDNILGYRRPVTQIMEEKWLQSAMTGELKDRIVFAIEVLACQTLIGFASIDRINQIDQTCYLGIFIGNKDYHGKGLGKEATMQLLEYSFNKLNMHKILLEVLASNNKAIALYVGLGFEKEGTLKKQVYLDGKHHDLIIMALYKK